MRAADRPEETSMEVLFGIEIGVTFALVIAHLVW